MGYFAENAQMILKSGVGKPDLSRLKDASEICDMAKDRWIVPRSERRPEYRL